MVQKINNSIIKDLGLFLILAQQYSYIENRKIQMTVNDVTVQGEEQLDLSVSPLGRSSSPVLLLFQQEGVKTP